ncbi:MAG TPA: tRNA-dependent cyclodipeptide synthase [Blastocatellia bacterium]|nr:tRNA-dependent cyclodipeptide synthase [Blastocatellia bacterium]
MILDKYVASIDSTIPRSYQLLKSAELRCYLPVSLETKPFTTRPMLDAIVSWITDNFGGCAIFVADSIHRLTLQITRNLSPHEAKEEAYRLGSRFLEENRDLFANQNGCRFELLRASSVERMSESAEAKKVLESLFRTNTEFASSIKSTAASFIDRRFKNQTEFCVDRSEMMNLSCLYLIEEIALFSCLVKMGWGIDVYPGEELPVLIEIAEGKYPDVPAELRSRVNIALKLKRVQQSG